MENTKKVYNLGKLFEDIQNTGSGSKLGVGIFEKGTFEGTSKGENYIDFNYAYKNRKGNQRIWFPPTDDKLLILKTKKDGSKETLEEARLRDFKERLAHIEMHIKILVSEEATFQLNFTNFDELCDKVEKILEPSIGTYINIKTIPESKTYKYATFSRYANDYNFYIELWEEGKKPTLTYNNYEEKLMKEYSKRKAEGGDYKSDSTQNSTGPAKTGVSFLDSMDETPDKDQEYKDLMNYDGDLPF